MDFEKIAEQLSNNKPSAFLAAVLANPQAPDTDIIFSTTLAPQLQQNAQFLASSDTLSPEDLENWQENAGFLPVAQTIDGDYIGGTWSATVVLPASLYRQDVEVYPVPLKEFFSHYATYAEQSAILPKS